MGNVKSEVDFLVKYIQKQKDKQGGNYKVVSSGGGHKKVLDSKGRSVLDDNGPVIISSSPGDARWRDLAVARLRRAGIIDKDPWGKGGSHDEHERKEVDYDAKAARREAELADNRSRQEKNQELRELVEPLIVKLGGWQRGTSTELAAAAQYWFAQNLPELKWPSDNAAQFSVGILRKGNMLGEDAIEKWKTFFKMLEASETPRQLYFDLVREARGVPPRVARGDNVSLAQRIPVVDPDEAHEVRAVPGASGLPEAPPDPFERVQPLREAHAKSGLVWNVTFSIDDYAEAQRALGIVQGMGAMVPGSNGHVDRAIEGLEKLLIKIGEFRFYEMVGRE